MKKFAIIMFVLMAFVAVATISFADEAKETKPVTTPAKDVKKAVEKEKKVTVTGIITSIDKEKSTITIKVGEGAEAKDMTFTVDAKKLGKLKADEEVNVTYKEEGKAIKVMPVKKAHKEMKKEHKEEPK